MGLKKMIRKVIFLSMLMVLFIMPKDMGIVNAADSVTENSDWEYSSSSITKYKGSGGIVVVPDEINGVKITSIGKNAFYGCKTVTSVVIPEGVESIGDFAFLECANLKSISLPSTLTVIGQDAFISCFTLSNISVAEGNKVFDSRNNCNALINKAENKLILGSRNTVIPDSVTGIGYGAFYNLNGLKEIKIPDNVSVIEARAFNGCVDLESVVLPKGLTKIDIALFAGCNNLKEITLPDDVTIIEDYAFYECSNLKSVVMPENIVSIKAGAFSGCTSLEKLTILNKFCVFEYDTSIDKATTIVGYKDSTAYEFAKKYDRKFELYGHTHNYGTAWVSDASNHWQVCECGNLTDKVAHTFKEVIDKNATEKEVGIKHNECSICGYKTATESIPKLDPSGIGEKGSKTTDNITKSVVKVTNIGKIEDGKVVGAEVQYIKSSVSKAKISVPSEVTIAGVTYKVTSIADNAFKGDKKLNQVTIPANVTKIGKNAFSGCKNLKTITIKSSKLKSVGKNAIKGIKKNAKISVPKKMKKEYQKLFKKNTGYKSSIKIK